MAWWLMPQTPDPEVRGSSPTRVKPCCVLEQGTFTPLKVLVIPRKRWLRPNMTEKLFTGTLRINQPTIFCSCTVWFVSETTKTGFCCDAAHFICVYILRGTRNLTLLTYHVLILIMNKTVDMCVIPTSHFTLSTGSTVSLSG